MKRFVYFLLCLFSQLSYSEDYYKEYGDWSALFIDSDEPVSFALTKNGDGAVAGAMCINSEQSCAPFIITGLSCEEGHAYPFLIMFDEGISAENLSCVIISNKFYYVMSENHLEMMVTSNKMGVAMGTDNGRFKASYFSLSGSTKAILAARQLANIGEKNAKKTKSSGHDEYL